MASTRFVFPTPFWPTTMEILLPKASSNDVRFLNEETRTELRD